MSDDDLWGDLADRFVDGQCATVRGVVRTRVVDAHLKHHLLPPPSAVIDVGGGAGAQAIPLAQRGHRVTILDPSSGMLDRASRAVSALPDETRSRIRLVEGHGEEAATLLGGERFAGVLCHGVLMYVADPEPLVEALCSLAEPGGVVSVVAKNREALAVGPALTGDWATAARAFDAPGEVNRLGLETRADTVDEIAGMLGVRGVDPVAWYGVRLFTDGWTGDVVAEDDLEQLLAVELEASRRDPYRRLSRLFHLVGRKEDRAASRR